jgi:hypothetical protein
MQLIREGLEEGLDVKIYAKPRLSFSKMKEIVEKLRKYKNLF